MIGGAGGILRIRIGGEWFRYACLFNKMVTYRQSRQGRRFLDLNQAIAYDLSDRAGQGVHEHALSI